MQVGQEISVNASVMKRDGHRCVACGWPFTLAVHHIITRELGGEDSRENLQTLCPNCHRLVHWLSVGKRLEGKPGHEVKRRVGSERFALIRRLAERIRRARQRTKLAGNRWIRRVGKTRGLIPWDQALKLVALRNGFGPEETMLLKRTATRVVRHIPSDLRKDCSIRLVKQGRYLSVNARNHLVFRTPAYNDDGTRQNADVSVIWSEGKRIHAIGAREWHERFGGGGRFAAIAAADFDLTFNEVLAMDQNDWRTFTTTCRDAITVRRTRNWVSNVAWPR